MNYTHINRALWGSDDSRREYLNNLLVKSLEEIKNERSIEEANYKRERLRADLLLATDGSPEAVERIYLATAPLNAKRQVEITDEYREKISQAVADALRSSPNLNATELKKWYAKYPSFSILSLLTSIESDEQGDLSSAKHELDLLETDAESSYNQWLSQEDTNLNANNHNGVADFANLNIVGDCKGIATDLKEIAANLRGKPNLIELFKREYGWPYTKLNYKV